MRFDFEAGTEIIAITPILYFTRLKEDDGEKAVIVAWLFFHFMITWGGR